MFLPIIGKTIAPSHFLKLSLRWNEKRYNKRAQNEFDRYFRYLLTLKNAFSSYLFPLSAKRSWKHIKWSNTFATESTYVAYTWLTPVYDTRVTELVQLSLLQTTNIDHPLSVCLAGYQKCSARFHPRTGNSWSRCSPRNG